MEYKLELKQIVDYPRCRMYRQFILNLIGNKKLRVNGNSHLYYYTVLCCYANFRTSYHMVEEHHIVWVYLQTDRGGQRKCLEVGKKPTVNFALVDEKPVAAYAYCNIHGLWKTDI